MALLLKDIYSIYSSIYCHHFNLIAIYNSGLTIIIHVNDKVPQAGSLRGNQYMKLHN